MNKPFVASGSDHLEELSKHVDFSKPVRIYKNLHKKCYSVKQGVVKCHTDYVCLSDVEFVVNEKGRQRVLAENKKNVHAFVKGYIINPGSINDTLPFTWDSIYYDPYQFETFVNNETPVHYAKYCDMLHGSGIIAYIIA